jgi:outer membrane protein assembly factor BamD (BamD/ComL family)
MLETDGPADQNSISRSRVVALLLEAGGILFALASLGWALVRFLEISRREAVRAEDVLTTLALLLGGLVAGLLMWGVAELIRKLEALPDLMSGNPGRLRAIESLTPAAAPAPLLSEAQGATIVELLREVRDISLLTPEERTKRLETAGRALAAELEREVPRLLREHRWREARKRVQEARERFPTFPQFEQLEKQIETMRAEMESRDVEQAERQIHDLSALEAWERAAEVVRELLERHPDSEKANALAAVVRMKYEKSQAEQRARLMAHAQEQVRQRDWQGALQTANTIVQRYPKSPEAEALRLQIPTLAENAEIQIRQRLEAHIRALIRERRYDAALQSANELIDRYPNSPQAEALRAQLPKLRERVAAMAGSF